MLEAAHDVEELAYRVIGAAMDVHTHLGPGLLESMYERAMAIELELRGLHSTRQHVIDVTYKGAAVGTARIDLIVADRLVVELKAIEGIAAVHVAQVNAYLALTGLELGLIFNFNVSAIKNGGVRRVIRSLE